MDEATLKIVADILPWLSPGILIALSAFWFRLRAGTSYGLLNRLYAIAIGGKDFHDDSTADFWKERKDVERFNALFNTRAKSLKDIHQFKRWIEANDLDSRRFTSISSWFDFEKRKVKKLNGWRLIIPFVGAALFALAAIPAIPIASAEAALIKFKGEENWLWLSHTDASSYSYNPLRDKSNDWHITAALCASSGFDKEEVAKATNLKPKHIELICQSLSSEEGTIRINEIIADQKLFWILVPICWILAFQYIVEAIRRVDALQARPYLLSKLREVRRRRDVLALSTGSQEANDTYPQRVIAK